MHSWTQVSASFCWSPRIVDASTGAVAVSVVAATGSSVGPIQAEQLTLQASGPNAVCVQYVESVWQGTIYSGFDGSFGQMCGQEWFWSSSTWGQTTDGKDYTPACIWVDGTNKKHKNKEHILTAMWVDMSMLLSGAPVPGDNTTTDTFCKSQIMKFSSTGVAYDVPNVPDGLNQDQEGKGPNKRQLSPGRFDRRATTGTTSSNPVSSSVSGHMSIAMGTGAPFPKPFGTNPPYPLTETTNPKSIGTDPPFPVSGTASSKPAATGSLVSANGALTQLVVSDISAHSATTLCNHDMSRGPDFVSTIENLFCDMETKTLYPLCTGSQSSNCFTIDKDQKKIRKRGGDGSGANDALHRSYRAVNHWQG